MLLAKLGYMANSALLAWAQADQGADPLDWFFWEDGEPVEASGPGVASEEEIGEAWGAAYATMVGETKKNPGE